MNELAASTQDANSTDDDNINKETPLTIMLRSIEARPDFKLWNTPMGDSYASFFSGRATETWPVESREFSLFVRQLFAKIFRNEPSSSEVDAVQKALVSRGAMAPLLPINVRVASKGDKTYIDIGDKYWRVIEIDKTGWRILDKSPIPFIRLSTSYPLHTPQRGGSINLLKKYLNYGSDDQFKLTVGFMVSAMRSAFEYPILSIGGSQNAGKTTYTEFLRELLDGYGPRTSSGQITNIRDFGVSARSLWLVTFDNMNKAPSSEMSDAMCRLATGFTHRERHLFTNGGTFEYTIYRPVIMNGIPSLVSKTDLARRCLFINLPDITQRQSVAQLRKGFEKDAPLILGALLDAVVSGFKNFDETVPDCPLGLYDVTQFVEAASSSLGWEKGEFSRIYMENRESFMEEHIESNAFSRLIVDMLAKEGNFYGDFESFSNKAAMYIGTNPSILPSNGKGFQTMLLMNKNELKTIHGIVVNEIAKDPTTRRRRYEIAKIPEDNRNLV